MIVALDKKGRIFLAQKYRKNFPEELIITREENDLLLFDQKVWLTYIDAKIQQLRKNKHASAKKLLYTSSYNTHIDNQGRLLIPLNIRKGFNGCGRVKIKRSKKCLVIKGVK